MEAMTKELVSRWFNKISQSEKNKPLLILGGRNYTPQQTYDEVMRGSDVGNQLQSLIEQGKYGTTFAEEQELMKQRLTMSLEEADKRTPDKILYRTLATPGVAPKEFTASQLLDEINNRTKVGLQWLNNEASFVQRILQVR